MTSTATTARATYYLRRVVHVAILGADTALCGVRLIGAIDTEFPASCENCAAHAFETHPRLWAQVQPVGAALPPVEGLPESTADIDGLLDEVDCRADQQAADDQWDREINATCA